jgi:hypothetical protein
VVAAEQRMIIRCFRDDLAGFVHNVSHGPLRFNATARRPLERRRDERPISSVVLALGNASELHLKVGACRGNRHGRVA